MLHLTRRPPVYLMPGIRVETQRYFPAVLRVRTPAGAKELNAVRLLYIPLAFV